VQVLWWRGEAWAAPGDFGPVIMPLGESLNFVATESFLWIGAYLTALRSLQSPA
jgi:hypothetical protein